MRRTVLGGILAGLALFLWESIAHMMLPLGEMGFKVVPNEPAFAAVLKEQALHLSNDAVEGRAGRDSGGPPSGLG